MDQSHDIPLKDLQRFYTILDQLETKTGGVLRLNEYERPDSGHAQGVYFFFQDGEYRSGSGRGRRVVRVGTHGLKATSKSTLLQRVSQHRGTRKGGGNQRGSIFRRHIGAALMAAGLVNPVPGWGNRGSILPTQRVAEQAVEAMISRIIGSMSFLWLRVNDEPGLGSQRGYVERNAIALLTTEAARVLDPPSRAWLGHHSIAPAIQTSGLWNVHHVGKPVDSMFLDRLWDMAQNFELPNQLS